MFKIYIEGDILKHIVDSEKGKPEQVRSSLFKLLQKQRAVYVFEIFS